MTLSTHQGSCHCGNVKFEVDIDLGEGTLRCNCSICSKARAWFAFAPAEAFRLLKGEGSLSSYRWTPSGKPRPNLTYRFCTNCGIRVFVEGTNPSGDETRAIAVTALDDIDADELANAIRYVDGAHDHFDRAPDDTRLL